MESCTDKELLVRILEKLKKVPLWKWRHSYWDSRSKFVLCLGDYKVTWTSEHNTYLSVSVKDRRILYFKSDEDVEAFIKDLFKNYFSRTYADFADIPESERQAYLDKFMLVLDSEKK
jgi:hypothetical protein